MITPERLKNYIQSANINFLIGSGLSRPYLITLGCIEKWLCELEESNESDNVKSVVQASLYKKYFEDVIYKNHNSKIVEDESIKDYQATINEYKHFLSIWNGIITHRYSNILNKQVNIFSTNIDLFVERAAEEIGIEFNDGFRGRFTPTFDEGNFAKGYSRISSHFQNKSDITVFNLLKIHGSIDWVASQKGTNIYCDVELKLLESIKSKIEAINQELFIDIVDGDNISTLIDKAKAVIKPIRRFNKPYQNFISEYDKLVIVNPTKRKFKETVLDLHFYELMRMLSNSMEKENSILFVHGFSFADEHIAKIIQRAADTNPTLIIIVTAFNNDEVVSLKNNLSLKSDMSKNDNIWIVSPENYVESNSFGLKDDDPQAEALKSRFEKFDFNTVNYLYSQIGDMIPLQIYER
ncbi:MAG: hypothetical protein SNI49_03400 [Rikenellaceae bacterium]